jgi:hypothetical protein
VSPSTHVFGTHPTVERLSGPVGSGFDLNLRCRFDGFGT